MDEVYDSLPPTLQRAIMQQQRMNSMDDCFLAMLLEKKEEPKKKSKKKKGSNKRLTIESNGLHNDDVRAVNLDELVNSHSFSVTDVDLELNPFLRQSPSTLQITPKNSETKL